MLTNSGMHGSRKHPYLHHGRLLENLRGGGGGGRGLKAVEGKCEADSERPVKF